MTAPPSTAFTDEELRRIESAFRETFRSHMKRGEAFAAAGTLDERHLGLRIELANPDRSEVTHFELAFELVAVPDLPLVDARVKLTECAGAVWEEYLREDRWPPPHLDWREYTFDELPIQVRGAFRNELAESMADAWLAQAEGGDGGDADP